MERGLSRCQAEVRAAALHQTGRFRIIPSTSCHVLRCGLGQPAVRGKGRGPVRKTPPSALHFPLVTQKKCDNSVSPAPPEALLSRFIPGHFTPKRLYLRSLSAGAAEATGRLKLVQKKLK